MTSLFISDLHLHKTNQHLTLLFEKFINQYAINANKLFILGDLFHSWIGDDAISEYEIYIASLLNRLSNHGVKIFFLSGNRDFLIGEKYASLAGFQVIMEPYFLNLDGKRLLLFHGDRQCWDDRMHQIYRKITGLKWLQFLFLKSPLSFRLSIANKLSSQGDNTVKDDANKHCNKLQNFDVCPRALEWLIKSYSPEIMIHGHTHHPIIECFLENNTLLKRFVLSDWGEKGNFLSWDGGDNWKLDYF